MSQIGTGELSEWAEELWHRAIDSDSESGPALLADALRRAAETGNAAARAPAWVQSVTPAEIVRQRSLKWPDFHPEDFCHQCGRRNPCWFADTEVWQTATESTGDGGGILCPSCLAALWEAKTGKTAILWHLSIDPRSRDADPQCTCCDHGRVGHDASGDCTVVVRGVQCTCEEFGDPGLYR